MPRLQPDQMSTVQKDLRELTVTMAENETIDRRLLTQGHRLLEMKTRQQDLMDEMANRIDSLFIRWQESQNRHQLRMQSSFNLASENLPLCSKTMLSLDQLDQFKKRLELIRLLVEADRTATRIHQRVSRNSAKLEQVAVKVEELKARLKKLITDLNNSTSSPNEARSLLLAELVRLEKVEGDKRQLAQKLVEQLKVFLEKTALSTTASQTSIANQVTASSWLQTQETIPSSSIQTAKTTSSTTVQTAKSQEAAQSTSVQTAIAMSQETVPRTAKSQETTSSKSVQTDIDL